MRLTSRTDFCLRILIYLQENEGKRKIQEVADAYGISKNHLSVAANKLSELGLIKTTSGPKGGIEIEEAAKERTIGEVVRRIENFTIVQCFDEQKNTCTLSPRCKLKNMLNRATKSFLGELENYRVKDLV